MADSQQKNNSDNELFGVALAAIFDGNLSKATDCINEISSLSLLVPLLRTAMLQPNKTTLWYQQMLLLWDKHNNPALKTNSAEVKLHIVTDITLEPIEVFITTKLATSGISGRVTFSEYDSAESECLNTSSQAFDQELNFVALILSTQWLERFFPLSGVTSLNNVEEAIGTLTAMLDSLKSSGNHLIVCEFLPPMVCPPCPEAKFENYIGVLKAIEKVNSFLKSQASSNIHVIDLHSKSFYDNGVQMLSAHSYARAKIPYSQQGFSSIGKAIASAVSSLLGKSNRAVVFDLDNTIWGGVLGEVGANGVTTGKHNPEALAYFRLQEYLNGLATCGIALGVASKNSPEYKTVFSNNPNLGFSEGSITAFQIHWYPKSQSISELEQEFGFGSEFFLFLDDNIFELAEVLTVHPYIDVVLACKDPVDTLNLIGAYKHFEGEGITTSDLTRNKQFNALQASRKSRGKFNSYEEYLDSLDVTLTIENLSEDNQERVTQLIQKSNQFNLTTIRHSLQDLVAMIDSGAEIGVVSYKDNFGHQGVISVVVLVHEDQRTLIDIWLMSCRVLNRTVEHAVCKWMLNKAKGKLVGKFVPTEKNSIVKGLYQSLGFTNISEGDDNSVTTWESSVDCESTIITYAKVENAPPANLAD